MDLERAGIPSVHIAHEALNAAAKAMAIACGMPDYRWLLVPYPYAVGGTWDEEEIRQLAAGMAPKVIEMLTQQP